MQITVENCKSVNINTLQKTVKRIINKDYPESTATEFYDYTLKELDKFTVNSQIFEYESLKNYLGGFRWFFKCPDCGKRCTKLFLPPLETPGKVYKYLCKTCHKLKNQSALQGQNNIYRKVTKPLKRMKEIEAKIARGHLTADRVKKLLNEYEKIEGRLKKSPEYRLYKFKKIHAL